MNLKLSRFVALIRNNMQMSTKSAQIHIQVIQLRFLYGSTLYVKCYMVIRQLFAKSAIVQWRPKIAQLPKSDTNFT
jgi:hypothetical protein